MTKTYEAHFRNRLHDTLNDVFKKLEAVSIKEAKMIAKNAEGQDETKWFISVREINKEKIS